MRQTLFTTLSWQYSDIIMSAIASQITGRSIVYSTICSGADQRKYESSVWLAFVRGIHRWPMNSPDKGSVTQTMFPFDDITMEWWTGIAKFMNWWFAVVIKNHPDQIGTRKIIWMPLFQWRNLKNIGKSINDYWKQKQIRTELRVYRMCIVSSNETRPVLFDIVHELPLNLNK